MTWLGVTTLHEGSMVRTWPTATILEDEERSLAIWLRQVRPQTRHGLTTILHGGRVAPGQALNGTRPGTTTLPAGSGSPVVPMVGPKWDRTWHYCLTCRTKTLCPPPHMKHRHTCLRNAKTTGLKMELPLVKQSEHPLNLPRQCWGLWERAWQAEGD